jgi:thiol:disulfide interchange protein DsbC
MNCRTLALVILLPLAACAQDSAAPGAAGTDSAAASQAPTVTASAPDEVIAPDDPRVALAAKIPGTRPQDLRSTPVAGIYEISHGAEISYVTADAKYVFSGDLYQVTTGGDFPNLSSQRRNELRQRMMADIPETEMIVFGPTDAKHTITVFTDIDCPWCQRLHSEMDEYNKLGIRVRYLFYPRSGPDTESWAKANAVWCAADRKAALTRAKQGGELDLKDCADSPVARDFALGREVGVTGTPGLVLESGELVPGYLSPPQLIMHLRAAEATQPKP